MNTSRNITTSKPAPELDHIEPLNARSVAVSVLLGSHPPRLPARAFVALAELFDIPSGTMRTALSRLSANDELLAEDGWYQLGTTFLDRQRSQDVGRLRPQDDWNGDWHTVIAADDQRDITARRAFRTTLANHRFGELRPAIWLRPANEPAPPATGDILVTTGSLLGRSPHEIVAQLWDLQGYAAAATSLDQQCQQLLESTDWDDPRSIAVVFPTAAATVRYLRAEPRLPAKLTPADWPVERLRSTYDQLAAHHATAISVFLQSVGPSGAALK